MAATLIGSIRLNHQTGFLFEDQDAQADDLEVPEDDFRVIRHAVLDLEQYTQFMGVIIAAFA